MPTCLPPGLQKRRCWQQSGPGFKVPTGCHSLCDVTGHGACAMHMQPRISL